MIFERENGTGEVQIEENELIDLARDIHGRDGEVEIDDQIYDDTGNEQMPQGRISESNHGAYIMAWVWVGFDDIKNMEA